MQKRRAEIVTFKVDDSLVEAMKGIPNRSEFIRSAIMAALDSVCPLCGGTGVLTPHQREHWAAFSNAHTIEKCASCEEYHVVCNALDEESPHSGSDTGGA